MVKRDYVFVIVLSVLNLVCLGVLLLSGAGFGYSYPVFTFDWLVFAFETGVLVVVDAVVSLIYFFGRKTQRGLILTATVFLICCCGALVVSGFCGSNFWASQNDEYDENFRVDKSLDDSMRLGGIRLNELFDMAQSRRGDFIYSYRELPGCKQLSLKCELEFNKADYLAIIESFDAAPELKLLYNDSDNKEGYVQLLTDIPLWESRTAWGNWDKFIIQFSEVDNTIYFELSGELDT